MNFRRGLLGCAAAIVLFSFAGSLGAQSVEFQGTTKGCFTESGQASCNPSTISANGLLLLYTASAFDQTTSSSGSATLDLGKLALLPLLGNFNGDTFFLNVLFATPTVDGAPAVITAALKGAVFFGLGGVSLAFDNAANVFSFETGGSSGTFSLTVDNISLNAADPTATIAGHVKIESFAPGTGVTATPEPATVALLATGLLALVPLYRRRRSLSSPRP